MGGKQIVYFAFYGVPIVFIQVAIAIALKPDMVFILWLFAILNGLLVSYLAPEEPYPTLSTLCYASVVITIEALVYVIIKGDYAAAITLSFMLLWTIIIKAIFYGGSNANKQKDYLSNKRG